MNLLDCQPSSYDCDCLQSLLLHNVQSREVDVGRSIRCLEISDADHLVTIMVPQDVMISTLRLRYCPILDLELRQYTRLMHLDLEHVTLDSIDDLLDCVKDTLITLYLSHIHGAGSVWCLHGFPKLDFFHMRDCVHVKELCIFRCPKLQHLTFSGCPLETLRAGCPSGPSTVSCLPNLLSLVCERSNLSSLSISALPRLTSLHLIDNNLGELIVDGATCPCIVRMFVTASKLAGRFLMTGHYPCLTTLSLDIPYLRSVPISRHMPELTHFDVSRSMLRDPVDLTPYDNLKFIGINFNQAPLRNLGGTQFHLPLLVSPRVYYDPDTVLAGDNVMLAFAGTEFPSARLTPPSTLERFNSDGEENMDIDLDEEILGGQEEEEGGGAELPDTARYLSYRLLGDAQLPVRSDMCIICHGDLSSFPKVVQLACCHTFCRTCTLPGNPRQCPICHQLA